MIGFVLNYTNNYTNICKEIGVKLDIEHCYDHVPKWWEQFMKV
jgi:hypothetical protein